MFKKKDDIKTFFVIIIVCILCLIVGLFMNKKNNTDLLVDVDEYNVYFSNVNYVNNYLNYIATGNNRAVYDLLDDDFVNKYDVNYDNVLDIVRSYEVGSYLDIDSMKFIQIDNNFVYLIEGIVYNNLDDDNSSNDYFSVILKNDYDNISYSLYPVDKKNYSKIINSIKSVSINVNDNNKLVKAELIKKEQMCSMYLSDFVNLLYNDIDGSYNLVSDNMKDRYSNIDNYISYVNNNFKSISTVADKCKLEEIEDKRVYVVIDDNNNVYKFVENNIMDYIVDFTFNSNY